jgi:hypothetical protein
MQTLSDLLLILRGQPEARDALCAPSSEPATTGSLPVAKSRDFDRSTTSLRTLRSRSAEDKFSQ